jgi:hypothetical protein
MVVLSIGGCVFVDRISLLEMVIITVFWGMVVNKTFVGGDSKDCGVGDGCSG